MTAKLVLGLLAVALLGGGASRNGGGLFVQAQLGADYIETVPPTVYEAEDLSPQNMDFDRENNMFIAHPGWYNDVEIHYYKFRIFAPGTYDGVIVPGSTAMDVPVQKIYLVSSTADFTDVVGLPIIEYHTSDNNAYSDFMEVFFVEPPSNYTENDYKSAGDVLSSGAVVTPAGAVINLPVVPTGATLQHPHEGGTNVAPIQPTLVWYKGQEVTTYVFEVTTADAKTYFDNSRNDPSDVDFEVSLQPMFASSSTDDTEAFVSTIPLWHFNQYSFGVVPGENGGGPNPAGMRNLIQMDRADGGYSPLWNILWLTQLPMNYEADDISNPSDVDLAVGFEIFQTPMFINCPDIGSVGTEENQPDTSGFTNAIDATQETTMIFGSHMTLIFENDVKVSFMAGGTEIASTQTNPMGAYETQLSSCLIPMGTTELDVMANNISIRTIPVNGDASSSCLEVAADTSSVGSRFPGLFVTLGFPFGAIAFVF